MKKSVKYLIITAIVTGIIGVTYIVGFTSEKDDKTASVANLLSAQVVRGDIKVSASGSSTIESSNKKDIKALDSGTVESLFVKAGEVVNEGDLLVTFEDDSTNSEIDRIKLELQQEIDELQDINDDVSSLKIYAPQGGYLGDISVEVGEDVSSGYTLTTIINKDTIEIPGYFHKSQLNNIKLGDKATITLPEYLSSIEGVVTKINHNPNPREDGAVLYEVIAEVVNPGALTENVSGVVVIDNSSGHISSVEETQFKSPDSKDIKISTGGKIKNLFVSGGEYVKKGQLLVELESPNLQRQIENQQITIDKKTSELSEKLKVLDDAAIYAPISGTVTEINITEGERVGANTVLLVITDLNNLQVIIPVDELDINKIKMDQEAQITAEAVSDKIFNANVSKIALEGTSQNGVATFDVTLQIDEPIGLKPGMTGEGEILVNEKKNTLLLPIEAVQRRQKESFVLIGTGNDPSDATLVPVKIGLVTADYVEITEGVSEGDMVFYYATSTNSQSQFRQGVGMMGIGGGIPKGTRPDQGGR